MSGAGTRAGADGTREGAASATDGARADGTREGADGTREGAASATDGARADTRAANAPDAQPAPSRVYLDHAATSPVRPEVLEAMLPWFSSGFGNANTLYQEGKQARRALDAARATLARVIGARPTEVVFTSGGTESNNALISGITRAIRVSKGRQRGGNHVLTSAFEHHAVLEPVQALKREGYEISLVRPTREGFIAPDAFAQALRPDTVLASVMLAQNELGCIQAIAELARIAHANGTLLHSDAVQALGRCAFDVDSLGVDAASFSAHKLGGPKGIGAFYLRGRTPFSGTQLGGGQENNRRGGTQNVAGAVGFARALELASLEQEKEAARLRKLRDYLAASLLALDRRIALTVPLTDSPNSHLPGMLNFTVAGFESQTLILKLDRAGFALSGGSACSSGSLEPSHVLSALGLSRDRALGALRVSLGRENTGEQLDAFLAALAEALGH